MLQDEKPDFSRHQFGGSLGGPIVEDKAHFYVSAEYTDESSFFTVNTGGVFPSEEGTFEKPDWNFMGFARLDYAINDDHRLFARYAHHNNELTHRGSGGIRAASSGFSFGAPRHSLVLGETWFLSPNTFNDFRVQVAHATYIGWPPGHQKWGGGKQRLRRVPRRARGRRAAHQPPQSPHREPVGLPGAGTPHPGQERHLALRGGPRAEARRGPHFH